MKVEEDHFYECMWKQVILRPEDASLKQWGHERHSRGENTEEASVKVGNMAPVSNTYVATYHNMVT